jgi:hypothetical protein
MVAKNDHQTSLQVKNTPFARKFLLDWAEMEFWQPLFSSSDNGALQLHILKTVLPGATVEINVTILMINDHGSFAIIFANRLVNAIGTDRPIMIR